MMSSNSTSDSEQTKLFIRNSLNYPRNGLPRTLVELHINNMKQTSLNKEILTLTKLRLLDVSHNYIKSLPPEISKLPNLNELHVSHNKLGEEPLSVEDWAWLGGHLSKTLKLLDVSNNNLKFLPEQIIKLHALIELHIDHNNIIFLPSGMGNLRNLKSFSASNNLILILPGSVINWRLENLDFTNNNFSQCKLSSPIPGCAQPLPVCTLKEYAGRQVLFHRLPYAPDIIPKTLVEFLDYAKYCVCGKACFSAYIWQQHRMRLILMTESFSSPPVNIMPFRVPVDCYFCSLQCLHNLLQLIA